MEALAKRYGLKCSEEADGSFQLDGSGVRIRGKQGDAVLEVNRLHYRLAGGWQGAPAALGQADVAGLLDPLLQPALHMEAERCPVVYLDAVETGDGELAGKVAAMLQATLEGYEVKVKAAGDPLPEKDFLWLRLRTSAKDGNPRASRCLVVARPDPEAAAGGVQPGEFFDAESLILATLIQTGLVLGPGASGGGAEDGGIDREFVAAFAKAAAPAVCVEWGSGLDPAHVVKSLAAGVLRFQRFLASDSRSRTQEPAFGRREVKLSRVDLRDGPAEGEVQLLLSVSGKAADLAEAARDEIDFPVRLFVLDSDGLVRMLPGVAPRVQWGTLSQVPGDETAMATARAIMALPAAEFLRLKSGFWGYAVWLIRKGVVEDRRATPNQLRDQLWRWEGS